MVVILLSVIFIGVLELTEQFKDPLRLGLQDYLSQTTGHNAEISDLVEIELFPDVLLAMKGVAIRDAKKPEKTLLKVGSAYLSLDFRSYFLNLNRYRLFEIKQMEIATGYLFPQKMALSYIGITDPTPAQSQPVFLIEGVYNTHPLLATAQMERMGRTVPFSYRFQSLFPVSFKLGPVEAKGVFSRHGNKIGFADIALTRNDQTASFAADDIRFSPLAISIAGKAGNVPFTGSLARAEGGVSLNLVAKTKSAAEFGQFRRFVFDILNDFGVKDKSEIIKVTINQNTEA